MISDNGDLKRDFYFMRKALEVCEQALVANEVPIGCVIVLNDEVISSGFNQTNVSLCGIRHAELVALEAIYEKYRSSHNLSSKQVEEDILPNCEVYVSVEPCIMCASALRQIGIQKVVFGCCNDRFGGNGTVADCNRRTLKNWSRSYLSYPGIMQKEAVLLLRKFYLQQNEKAPQPRQKKQRIFNDGEIPPIVYNDYLSRNDFIAFYGKARVGLYDGESLKNEKQDEDHCLKKRRILQ